GIDDLVASGLTIRKEGASEMSARGFYDRFRGRVMFPIRDVHGAVVGFTGRLLDEQSQQGGKYMNSPQTPIYDKSRIIFGLDRAKQAIRQHDFVVLVEGQMDVISSHQAGVTHVVATSGTALTSEQIKLVQRYTKNVRMAFDTDEAGVAAAKRGIDLALEAGLSVKVIAIPGGKDPDECIRENKDAWIEAVENARDVMEWYFDRVLTGDYMSDPRKKQQAADQLLAEIVRIPHAVERDHWLQQLSRRINVGAEVLREDATRIAQESKKKYQPQATNTAGHVKKLEPRKKTRLETLVEHLMALYLKFPDMIAKGTDDEILYKALSTYGIPGLYELLKTEYTNKASINFEALRSKYFESDTENSIDVLLFKGESIFLNIDSVEAERETRAISQNIRNEWAHHRRQIIEQEMLKAEKESDSQKLQQLMEELKILPH
ncbi:MAG: hypothetical protein COU68_03840, partial [Candidatus Pacebacteria bacterium CG10_big_fil_rev_8_21_14_0_10_45_6]